MERLCKGSHMYTFFIFLNVWLVATFIVFVCEKCGVIGRQKYKVQGDQVRKCYVYFGDTENLVIFLYNTTVYFVHHTGML